MKFTKLVSLASASLLVTMVCRSQSADEIALNYINATGGQENWKKVSSIVYEATLRVHGSDVALYKTILHGKGMRQNMTGMGITAFQITTPAEGWSYLPFEGQIAPEPVSEDIVKLNADHYDAQGVLVDHKLKGHILHYAGKETIDGMELHKLEVKHKSGKMETLYFDPGTSLMIRSVVKQTIKGKETDVITKFGNYQKLPDGIFYPMNITLPFGELTIKKVEVNKKVNENIFKPIN